MASFFSSNKVIGLIDRDTGKIKVDDKINIILTPSYYWTKRAYLEVKFTYMALKYAPSIFEGMLPKGDYDYYAVKTKTDYIFFAYEPDMIISSLKAKGIQESQIAGIYFAQNELLNIGNPIQCNDKDALVVHNGTVLQVRKYLIDESLLKQNLDGIKDLSRHKVVLHKSSVTHSFKALTPLLTILGLLVALYIAQIFYTYSQQREIKSQPSVFSTYGLPATYLQNSSIEKKLTKSFNAQKSFRELISAVLKLPLSERQRIESLSYEKEVFKIEFKMDDYAGLADVERYLKGSIGKSVNIKTDKNIIRVTLK